MNKLDKIVKQVMKNIQSGKETRVSFNEMDEAIAELEQKKKISFKKDGGIYYVYCNDIKLNEYRIVKYAYGGLWQVKKDNKEICLRVHLTDAKKVIIDMIKGE